VKIEERLTELERRVDEILEILKPQLTRQKLARQTLHAGTMEVKLYAQTLGALSNPIRIAILNRLAENGCYYNELEKLTGMPPAPLSFHLKALKSSGLVHQDAERGKYLITELGLNLLELVHQLANTLYGYETKEVDRYCFSCSQSKMKADVSPVHFRIWCPKCGGDHGSKWSFTLLNPFGEEWQRYGIEKLIEKGWQETFQLVREAVQSNRCINCNAQMKYVFHDDQIEGKCPLCGQHYSMRTNDLTPDRLFLLWKKHNRLQQKTEGPVEKDGVMCWKITAKDDKGKVIAEQYVKIGQGEEVAWKEF
jgi:DNA-binding transcriptional ArsR family regulator/phage FluMu protein Com